MSRDDFKSATKELIAKRVGFSCSNPDCRQPTIGASSESGKAVNIGIAAHITAASEGGPRFDASLKGDQRRHFDNGIWLCSNCATLIDRDEQQFTVDLLIQWKDQAELESMQKLKSITLEHKLENPIIDVDFGLSSALRMNRGFSSKNPFEIIDGMKVFSASNKPIIVWELRWSYTLSIYNNSMVPAFNISIESVGENHFIHLGELKRVNNLPPLEKIEVDAVHRSFFEGTGDEAEEYRHSFINEFLNNVVLAINFRNNTMENLESRFAFREGSIHAIQ